MKNLMHTVLALIFTLIICTNSSAQAPEDNFTIYRWIKRINNLPTYITDLPEVKVMDSRNFFDPTEDGKGYKQEINWEKTIQKAKGIKDVDAGQLRVIDIEHLPIFSKDPQERINAQAKIGAIVDVFKKYDGGHCYGVYCGLVDRQYHIPWDHYRAFKAEPGTFWALRKDKAKDAFDKWITENSHVRWGNPEHTDTIGLADKVDIACPSLYSIYRDPKRELMKDPHVTLWPVFAEYMVREVRKNEKRVIPFIMFAYPKAGNYDNHWVEEEFVKLQLDTVKKYCDGVILYQYGNEKGKIMVDYDANWPWARALRSFIRENK